MNTCLRVVALALVLGTMQADSAPVADEDRVPIDLRRTTLIVENIENSLTFYRDALGLEVIYDHRIRTPREARTDEQADRSLRLVFLRSNDDYVGIVGLMQYMKPVRPAPREAAAPFSTGSIVMLFNATDLDTTFAKARTVPGVTVLSEPRLTKYPSYDGKGTISVNVSMLKDPDGFIIELNQLLEELH